MGLVKVTFKAETNRVHFHRVQMVIMEAVAEGVDKTLAYGRTVAKKHAPVRKVTRRGGRPSTRDLTDDEIADLPEFARRGLNPITGASIRTGRRPQTTVKRSLATRDNPGLRIRGKTFNAGRTAREVRLARDGSWELRNPKVGQFLNSQGRYALDTGVGVHVKRLTVVERTKRRNPATGKMDVSEKVRHGYRATLGGRLRDEIYASVDSVAQAGVFTGQLVSPTEYAQYVEFPTSRTAAQPYMRPARDAMAARLPVEIERQMTRVARQIGGG